MHLVISFPTESAKPTKGDGINVPSAHISFGTLETPWLRGSSFFQEALCPIHGRQEITGTCPYLGVMAAPLEFPIVITDIGSALANPPESLPGWEAIWMKGTHGGAHGKVAYARHGLTAEQLAEFLSEHLSSDLSCVKLEDGAVVVWASQLGLWIGRQGRWAKSYQRLGIKVDFKELKECSRDFLSCRSEELRDLVEKEAVVAKDVMRDNTSSHNSTFLYGLDPRGSAWKEVQRS